MLERPDLDDEIILVELRRAYGISATVVTFLPIGYDANAWVFEVQNEDGGRYFLKVRQGPLYAASVIVPSYLHEIGIQQVLAPIQTNSADLWTNVDRFTLLLYPYIDGGNGNDAGMTDNHWHEFGRVLKQIHVTTLPDSLYDQVDQETFNPKWAEMVRLLQAKISSGDFFGPHEQALAAFWLERQDEIERIVEITMDLGRLLRARCLPNVLCHADAHIFNVLIDKQDQFYIIDWDGIILAPKERDLMFMLSAGTNEDPDNNGAIRFRHGYGTDGNVPTDVDAMALAYYRYEWVVQEIGDFGKRVFLTKDTGDVTQRESVEGFIELFDPDDVVEGAYAAYPLG